MFSERRLYVAVCAMYGLSRALLFVLGIRFYASYGWQFFFDQDLLRDRLWESLVYAHAFTPFMSLLAGLVLKLSETHSVAIYHGIFLLSGLGFACSFAYLLRVLGLSRIVTLSITTLFCLTPTFLYFETMLHYEFLAAALVCVSVVLFHRALQRGSFATWFSFFLTCALIAYVRTTFHLVWIVAMITLALVFQRERFRVIVVSALLPVLLVLSFYAKNQVLYGFFGTSSMFGFNLAFVTTQQLTKRERRVWVKQGKMHPASALSVYAGPEAYASWVDVTKKTNIPVLERLARTDGQPNFNHHSFIEVSKIRMKDNQYYLAHERARYVQTVLRGIEDYFRPSSRWHPNDPKGSPHRDNRRVLEPYENFVNALFHGFPVAPFGVYPLLLLAGGVRFGLALSRLWRSRFEGHVADKLVIVMTASAIYVPTVSCLVTITELERYRFLVEGFMWINALALFGRPVASLSRSDIAGTLPNEGTVPV